MFFFLQSYVMRDMSGGRLRETESKRISLSSVLKSGPLRESFKTIFVYETRWLFSKWSLSRTGRYERVDCSLVRPQAPKFTLQVWNVNLHFYFLTRE